MLCCSVHHSSRHVRGGDYITSTSKALADLYKDSQVLVEQHQYYKDDFPAFTMSELELGNELGHGEFGQVLEILNIADTSDSHLSAANFPQKLVHNSSSGNNNNAKFGLETQTESTERHESDDDDEEEEEYIVYVPYNDEMSAKERMRTRVLRDGVARYAVKQIRPALIQANGNDAMKLQTLRDAVIDLACEAVFLRHLPRHDNIIKLRGTVGTPGTDSYMLVLDRLVQNLHQKINQDWLPQLVQWRRRNWFKPSQRKSVTKQLLLERILVLWQVAKAFRHLHRHSICYRDIKPLNIGIDVRGDACVFDFGLSRELKVKDKVGSDEYDLTGLTGSRPYMAPEVVLCKPYGLSSDVYSFGLLMWQVLSLHEPFTMSLSATQLVDQVVLAGKRPRLSGKFPAPIEQLMAKSWAAGPHERPSFARICQVLENELGCDHITNVNYSRHSSFASFYESDC